MLVKQSRVVVVACPSVYISGGNYSHIFVCFWRTKLLKVLRGFFLAFKTDAVLVFSFVLKLSNLLLEVGKVLLFDLNIQRRGGSVVLMVLFGTEASRHVSPIFLTDRIVFRFALGFRLSQPLTFTLLHSLSFFS